jgi:hypothetical protein
VNASAEGGLSTYGGESAVALQGRANWQHCLILWERFSMKFGAANVRAIKVVLVRTCGGSDELRRLGC